MFHGDEHSAGINYQNMNRDKPIVDLFLCIFSTMIMTSVVWQFATEAARIQTQVKSCGICDEQSNTGANFLLVLRFSL
jgi:hypothetical protein